MSEIDRDRRIEAAWNAASREQPPPALDEAIRAAARRAVDAAPGSRRNKHWWYPLAAAATVAVLAVGIAQLTPPERGEPAIVADMTTAPREAQQNVERRSPAVEAMPAAPPEATPPAAPAPAAARPAKPAPGVAAGTLASERARVAAPNAMKKQAAEAKTESSPQDKLASAAAETGSANSAPPAPAAANAPAGAVAPQVQRSAAGAAVEQPLAQSRRAAGKVAQADEAKAKDASARSIEEWIRRIRDLRNEGHLDEAAKEIAAFRAAYGDRADALLPADLRTMKAQSPAK